MPDSIKPWVQPVGPNEFGLVGKTGLAAWPVYMALRWYAGTSESCFPSTTSLAKLLDIPQRTICYHLAALESKGLVERQYRRGKMTIYRLLGTDTSCSPTIGGLQNVAEGHARCCGRPVQDVAANQYHDQYHDQGKTTAQPIPPVEFIDQTYETTGRKPRPRATFAAPTSDEVSRFWIESNLQGDPDAFFDHYTANGWRQGQGAPLEDWQAAARSWSRRELEFAGRNGSSRNGDDDQPLVYAGKRKSTK